MEKAAYLAALLNKQYQHEGDTPKRIYFEDHRLKRATRLTLYLSCIMPYKFLSSHRGTKYANKILQPDNASTECIEQVPEDLLDEVFISSQVKTLDSVFNNLYEDRFINYLFPEGRTIVTHDEFISKFKPNGQNMVKETLFG